MANTSSSHGCCVFLLLALSLFNFTARFSHATPTLFPNQTIFDGQSVISASKTYELGFFSPEGSNSRYVGVWYHNIPGQVVVWVANRERPLLDTSGFITFDPRGNLIILDSIGSSIVIASSSGTTSLTTATLLDSGNLVLREWTNLGNGQVLWQSFDNPTDTFLAGMKLGLDGRQNRVLTSWMSPQDPSPGEFSMGLDPNGTKQFMIWRRGKVHWTSGIWDGHTFPRLSKNAARYMHDLGYVANWSGGYYTFHLKDSSIISRTVMDYTGQPNRLTWMEDKWVAFADQSARAACEIPYYCGANGLCSNNTSPPCKCLFGFEPNKEEQWKLGNWIDGCKRELPLECENGDGFLRLRNVELPLFCLNIGNSSVGLEDCKAKCSSNCSCSAYASANGNGTGCLLWFGELMGLQESSGGVQDLYVRLVASELNQGSGNKNNLFTNLF